MGPQSVLRNLTAVSVFLLSTQAVLAQGVSFPMPSVLPDGQKMSPLIARPAINNQPNTMPGTLTRSDGPITTHSTAPSPVKDLTPPELSHNSSHEAAGHMESGTHGMSGMHAEEHEGGLFGSAEYLLLRPRRGAFDYASVSSTTAPNPSGPLENLNYALRSGVRASIGYRLPGEGWDIAASYTFLRSSASDAVSAPAGGVIYPTLTRPGLVDFANSASANASVEYNVFDAEVGKRFKTELGSYRLYGGARFASIRQGFDATYDGRDAQQSRVRTKNNFDGFGPIVGGEATLNAWRHFQLFAKANAGLLTGRITAPLSETNQNDLVQYSNLTYNVNKVVPTAGIGIGGGWSNGRVAIRVGYEITQYFGLVQTPRYTGDFSPGRATTTSSDFSLEGLFVQMAVGF